MFPKMDMVSGASISSTESTTDRMKVIRALAGRVAEWSVPGADEAAITELTQAIAAAREEGGLPPLFEADDWLWVSQGLGYLQFAGDADARLAASYRRDRIRSRILEYLAARHADLCDAPARSFRLEDRAGTSPAMKKLL